LESLWHILHKNGKLGEVKEENQCNYIRSICGENEDKAEQMIAAH
jgi:hypothetical protein